MWVFLPMKQHRANTLLDKLLTSPQKFNPRLYLDTWACAAPQHRIKLLKEVIMRSNIRSERCGRRSWLDDRIREENKGSRSHIVKRVGRQHGLKKSGRNIQSCIDVQSHFKTQHWYERNDSGLLT